MAQNRTVRIGPILFEIEETADLHGDDGKRIWGEVSHGDCKIRIHERTAPQQQRQTLWHEIVHVILIQAGRTEQGKDEGLVDLLAYGIMCALQDNPWLAKREEIRIA